MKTLNSPASLSATLLNDGVATLYLRRIYSRSPQTKYIYSIHPYIPRHLSFCSDEVFPPIAYGERTSQATGKKKHSKNSSQYQKLKNVPIRNVFFFDFLLMPNFRAIFSLTCFRIFLRWNVGFLAFILA